MTGGTVGADVSEIRALGITGSIAARAPAPVMAGGGPIGVKIAGPAARPLPLCHLSAFVAFVSWPGVAPPPTTGGPGPAHPRRAVLDQKRTWLPGPSPAMTRKQMGPPAHYFIGSALIVLNR